MSIPFSSPAPGIPIQEPGPRFIEVTGRGALDGASILIAVDQIVSIIRHAGTRTVQIYANATTTGAGAGTALWYREFTTIEDAQDFVSGLQRFRR